MSEGAPSPRPRAGAAALLVLAALLVGTAVRGAYTIDENNYLVTLLSLRSGGLSLPDTATLTPSRELHWFDPLAMRMTPRTPLVSSAPPLWAFVALPFSYFGWYGLVALNALAFVITIWLVHRYAHTRSKNPATAWLAGAAVLFGGFSLEYAQGVWPHSLTMCLCAAAVVLAAEARLSSRAGPAVASGLLVGLAMGMRYQNIVFAAAVGLGLLLYGKRRWLRTSLFALGLAVPVLASSLLNHERLGWWSPISKGPGYARLHTTSADAQGGWAWEFSRTLYAKIVDFSTHPPMGGAPRPGMAGWRWEPHPDLGAYFAHGAVKKALLQSAPWLAVALLILILAWRRRTPDRPPDQVDEARALSLVFGAVFLLFGLGGFGRQDGLCSNQRYFLELIPVGAAALALGLDRLDLPRRALLTGAALGLLTAMLVLLPEPESFLRVSGLLYLPLLLAAASALVLLALHLGLGQPRLLSTLLAALLGACLAWAAAVHLADDLPAASRRRLAAADVAERWDSVLPPRAALFVYFGGRDISAPLHLGRDLLVVDPWLDGAQDAPRVADDLLRTGRRVFIDLAAVPTPIATRIRGAHPIRIALPGERPIWELLP
jgi:hypothetical protein